MDFDRINKFLKAKDGELKEQFGFDLDGRTWLLVRGTIQRTGNFWPLGGFRRLGIPSKFVEPGKTTLDKKPFNEIVNFKNSFIGEVASRPRATDNGKNVLYWLYGIEGYIPVKNPCVRHEVEGGKPCECDVHMTALLNDFENAIRKREHDFYLPIIPDLKRSFTLRVSSQYGQQPPDGVDHLPASYTQGFFIPAHEINVRDGQIVTTEKPKPNVRDTLRSTFALKNIPEDSFILPNDSYAVFDVTVDTFLHPEEDKEDPAYENPDASALSVQDEIVEIDPTALNAQDEIIDVDPNDPLVKSLILDPSLTTEDDSISRSS